MCMDQSVIYMSSNKKRPAKRPNVPWIAKDGYFDVSKFPIDSVLQQTLSEDLNKFRMGCTLMESMHSHGRTEAGVYLLGLLWHCQNDFEKLSIVVEKLQGFNTISCADALFSELRRVRSSNSTQRYLNVVLKTLSSFPYEMVSEEFDRLTKDKSFSYRMRKKFSVICESTRYSPYRFYKQG